MVPGAPVGEIQAFRRAAAGELASRVAPLRESRRILRKSSDPVERQRYHRRSLGDGRDHYPATLPHVPAGVPDESAGALREGDRPQGAGEIARKLLDGPDQRPIVYTSADSPRGMRHPSQAARAIRNNLVPTTTAPMAGAPRSPAHARRSTVKTAARQPSREGS